MDKSKIIIASILSTFLLAQPVLAKLPSSKAAAKTTSQQQVRQVNVNRASAKEIAGTLSGIGIKKAQAIVDYRQVNGDFKTADDIVNVKGIGVSTLRKNRGKIALN